MNRYQRGLLVLLCIATLFSGFAGLALSQTLPSWRLEFGLGREQTGTFIALINIGQVLSYLLVYLADRLGRRPIFLLTLGGSAATSMATACMPSALTFGLLQLLTRVFMVATPAVAAILAAEELPAKNRGLLVGMVIACAGLGGVICAALVPLFDRLAFGWRTVYLVAGLPLLALLPGLRWLKETAYFSRLRFDADRRLEMWSIWRSDYRGRMLQLAAVWFLTNLCGSGVVLFWKEFALTERGLRATQVGGILAVGSLLGMPIAFLLGQLSDRLGRRRAAVIVYSISLLGVMGAFTLWSPIGLCCSLCCAIVGSYALPGLLDTITAETFPTHIRAAAFAWANNCFGRSAFIASPLLVGELAQHVGWGAAVLSTAVGPMIALLLLLRMHETAGKSL